MIAIVDGNGALVRLDFHDDNRASAPRPKAEIARDDGAVVHIQEQIAAYFRRELRVFDLPLAPVGNAFLLDAWSHLTKVPYGTTTTYGALAQRLPKPTSARAMGRANAINPISIVVPCHRLLGATGSSPATAADWGERLPFFAWKASTPRKRFSGRHRAAPARA